MLYCRGLERYNSDTSGKRMKGVSVFVNKEAAILFQFVNGTCSFAGYICSDGGI